MHTSHISDPKLFLHYSHTAAVPTTLKNLKKQGREERQYNIGDSSGFILIFLVWETEKVPWCKSKAAVFIYLFYYSFPLWSICLELQRLYFSYKALHNCTHSCRCMNFKIAQRKINAINCYPEGEHSTDMFCSSFLVSISSFWTFFFFFTLSDLYRRVQKTCLFYQFCVI